MKEPWQNMLRPLVGTIRPDDYAEINEGVRLVQQTTTTLQQSGVRIEIPHPNRWWEYGSAMQALISMFDENLPKVKVLDVGSGWSPLGPAMAMHFGSEVVECEPDWQCREDRRKANEALYRMGKRQITVKDRGLSNLPEEQFDAVFCISVLEHVADEADAWVQLAKRVKSNGLLFVTTDCVPDKSKNYVMDNMRVHKFTVDDLAQRVRQVTALGFVTMGKPDYSYNGPQVFDYSFFRAGMIHCA